MQPQEIFSKTDHTVLSPTATEADVRTLCKEAIKAGAASVCVPPCYVGFAAAELKGKTKVCTVIGFPNGYSTTECKIFETRQAVEDGADEVDMVINVGKLKCGDYAYVLNEMEQVRDACRGKVLKVIVETAYLTQKEKVNVCEMVATAGADYIKTSTGFAPSGANLADVRLFREHLPQSVKIKAAGGIRTPDDAEQFILAGADRIGASAIIKNALSEVKKQQ